LGDSKTVNLSLQNVNENLPKGLKSIQTSNTLLHWVTLSSVFQQLMLDVDSPNPNAPVLKQTEHFVVVNIPNSNIAGGDILAG